MAYGTARGYKPTGKRTYKKRPNRAPKPISSADAAYKLAADAARGVKYLRSLVNVERKWITLENVTPVATTTGSVTILNGVASGDGSENRDGDSIRFVDGAMNLTVTQHASATATFIRLIVVKWRDNDALAKDTNAILENQTDIKSFYEEGNLTKFSVLKDVTIALDSSNNGVRAMQWTFPGLNMKSTYSPGASGGAATDLQIGAIYLLTLSSEATNAPTVGFTSKFLFVDN